MKARLVKESLSEGKFDKIRNPFVKVPDKYIPISYSRALGGYEKSDFALQMHAKGISKDLKGIGKNNFDGNINNKKDVVDFIKNKLLWSFEDDPMLTGTKSKEEAADLIYRYLVRNKLI